MIIDDFELYEKENCRVINLIASENILCRNAKIPFAGDMYNRYSFENSQSLYFPGRKKLGELEQRCERIASQFLDSKYISLKPISGLNGMLCVLGSFLKPGDVVYTLDPLHGGHNVTMYMAERMGIKYKYIPFDEETMDVDYLKLEDHIKEDNPKMIYIDHMNVTFPINIKKLREKVGKRIYIIYDISHLMALVMGKVIANPLCEGADILVGSTHKTLPGPHKAIVATNSKLLFKIYNTMSGAFISSQHVSEVISLGIVMEELGDNMQSYARQIVRNARVMAQELNDQGIRVAFKDRNYTDTHQIWICDDKYEIREIVDSLAEYNILTNALILPFVKKFGVRIGVQEITYRGFDEEKTILLTSAMSDIIKKNVTEKTVNIVEYLKDFITKER